jgi:Fe/S biogenesis protein NfuA
MTEPNLKVTDKAASKILASKDAEGDAQVALRVVATEAGAKFKYELKLVAVDSKDDEDTVVPLEGIDIFMDLKSSGYLRGATLDYVEGLTGAGLQFDNPNKTPLASNPLAGKVQEVLDDRINPGLASHGGNVSLVSIEETRVILSFGGGCQGCGMADVTMKDGVAAQLQQQIPEITEAVDITDHGAGENPYFA